MPRRGGQGRGAARSPGEVGLERAQQLTVDLGEGGGAHVGAVRDEVAQILLVRADRVRAASLVQGLPVQELLDRLGPGQDGVTTASGAGALELDGYGELPADLKARVRATQFRAARGAKCDDLRSYWSIGHDILERQAAAGWVSKVVTRLAADPHREFPD